jgi:hypothetical protein
VAGGNQPKVFGVTADHGGDAGARRAEPRGQALSNATGPNEDNLEVGKGGCDHLVTIARFVRFVPGGPLWETRAVHDNIL